MIRTLKYAGRRRSLKNAIKLTELVYKDLQHNKSIWSQPAEHPEVFEHNLPVEMKSLHARLFVIAKMVTDDLAERDIAAGIISCLIIYTKLKFRSPTRFMKRLTKENLNMHPEALRQFLATVFEINCYIVTVGDGEYECYI
jgi:hypothetical protein